MKIILSSPILGEIDQLKGMLVAEDVVCFTRNEISAGLSPEIPLSESTPELWIQNDYDLAKALKIKNAWKTPALVKGSDWVCPTCGETSEPQFSSCWKCGAVRNDDNKARVCSDDALKSIEQATLPEKKEILEEEGGKIPCVSCGERIKIGVKYCPFCDYTQPYEAVV